MPPTTIGRAPAASSPSISACASAAYSPALKRTSTGRIETSRCSRRACSAAVATPGEGLEAAVDLQRVGGDGDRPLAAGAQPLGERERERRLADARSARRRPTTAASRPMPRSIVRTVSVRIGCGLSQGSDPRVAAIEAGTRARAGLGGAPADVAFVFSAGTHLSAPEATLEGVEEALDAADPRRLRRGRRARRAAARSRPAPRSPCGRRRSAAARPRRSTRRRSRRPTASASPASPTSTARARRSSSPTPTRSRRTPCSPSWAAGRRA